MNVATFVDVFVGTALDAFRDAVASAKRRVHIGDIRCA